MLREKQKPAPEITGAYGDFQMKKNSIPEETIRRLSLYLRILMVLEREKIPVISSKRLVEHLPVTSAQARRDLAYFGSFGKRGVGYPVTELKSRISGILGLDREWPVVLVGAGRLGQALADYKGFRRFGFHVRAVFDNNPRKIGRKFGTVTVRPVSTMEDFIRKHHIRVAAVAVPASAAQETVDRLVSCGVTAVLNFAPRYLELPGHVHIKSVDMAMELESLVYHLKQEG